MSRRSYTIYELCRFPFRAQDVNAHERLAPRSSRELSFPHRLSVPPVAPNDCPLVPEPLRDRLITTVWQLTAARSPKSPSERTPSAEPPGSVEDHECICAIDQEIVVDVIAVDNPPFTGKQGALFLEKLTLRHPDPAGLPTMKVEMDDGNASLGREHP